MRKADWMAGNYGIMVHFVPNLKPRYSGGGLDFNQMADGFDVKNFVSEVKAMGGKWILFPFGQNIIGYWSYNAVIEKYLPGVCSKRDLVLEIAIEAKRQGLRFIAYLHTSYDECTEEFRNAFGWNLSSDKKVFMERWTAAMRYYSEKFGDLLDGWWFDACYRSKEKSFLKTHDWDNSRFDEDKWFEAARAGNQNRITAMCDGANQMTYVFEQEEYLAGESSRTLEFYPWDYDSTEKQWHALICTDCFWGHCEREGEIDPPKFTDDEMCEYTKTCLEKRGAITWNVGIYQDSTMAEKTVAQIKRLKERLGI
ncbi:MAG: alpha-L-fucosidase [Monoglobales bacterium]